MNTATKVLIVIVVLSIVGIFAYKIVLPYLTEIKAYETSDAKDMKGIHFIQRCFKISDKSFHHLS